MDRQRDAEINSAGGDKDKIKAIRDRYKPQYDALKTRRQDLSLQKIDSGNASAADKAAYDAAKKDLDDKFKKDKDDRKAAYDKALGELKDQVGSPIRRRSPVGRGSLRRSSSAARSPTCWASSASTTHPAR